MFTIKYHAPYAMQWRTQQFDTKDAALRMIDFYQSCGTPAYMV